MYDLIIRGEALVNGTGATSPQVDDEGKPTGAIPGKLVRAPQPAPAAGH